MSENEARNDSVFGAFMALHDAHIYPYPVIFSYDLCCQYAPNIYRAFEHRHLQGSRSIQHEALPRYLVPAFLLTSDQYVAISQMVGGTFRHRLNHFVSEEQPEGEDEVA
jgi:hypothetical protein